jgi:hypothetical protein
MIRLGSAREDAIGTNSFHMRFGSGTKTRWDKMSVPISNAHRTRPASTAPIQMRFQFTTLQ